MDQGQTDHPFGDLALRRGPGLQASSRAKQEGAANLLIKARRGLAEDDVERAKGFVDRAVALPYDSHEDTAPAAWAAHMELFCLVADTLEASAEDDVRWLDAAIDVLENSDAAARDDMRDVLAAIDGDYHLNASERKCLRSAIEPIPARPELIDLNLGHAALADHVMSILVACQHYQAAVSGGW